MQLVLPMMILVFLTVLCLVVMVVSRIYAVRRGEVKAGYYKLYENKSDKPLPDYIVRIGRHYQNLMELPLVFYVLCLVAMQFGVSEHVEFWAWFFVVTRVLHSVIHLLWNHVLYRMLSFALGCIAIIGMSVKLIGNIFL